jgi:hypothetical protein
MVDLNSRDFFSLPTEYSDLIHLFFHLRVSGMSLSSVDLEILSFWEKEGIKPEFIAKVMFEMKDECQEKGKIFPVTLVPISRKVNRILLKMREL